MEGLTPDAAVIAFLASKGVAAKPPTTSAGAEFINRAAFAANPLAGGLNCVTEGQKKTAEEAEWRSWKQWALSHADWDSWYSTDWIKLQPELEQLSLEYAAEERLRLQAKKTDRAASSIRYIKLVGLVTATLLVLAVVGSIVERKVTDDKRRQEEIQRLDDEANPQAAIKRKCDQEFDRLKSVYRSREDFNRAYEFKGCNSK